MIKLMQRSGAQSFSTPMEMLCTYVLFQIYTVFGHIFILINLSLAKYHFCKIQKHWIEYPVSYTSIKYNFTFYHASTTVILNFFYKSASTSNHYLRRVVEGLDYLYHVSYVHSLHYDTMILL